MRLTRVLPVFAAFVIALPNAWTAQAVAQDRGPATASAAHNEAVAWAPRPSCTLPADTVALQRTIPLDALAGLERMSSSVFVQAFLVQFVADSAAGSSRVSRCARGFITAPLRNVDSLRRSYPDVGSIIAALRTAENARLLTVQFGDSVRTLGDLVSHLQTDTSSASLKALQARVSRFYQGNKCLLTQQVCDVLNEQRVDVDSTLAARSRVDALAEQVRQASQAVVDAGTKARAALLQHATDSAQFELLRAATDTNAKTQAGQPPADAVVFTELKQKLDQWNGVLQSQTTTLTTLRASADSARGAQNKAQEAASQLLQHLQSTAQRLFDAVKGAPQAQQVPAATGGQVTGGIPVSLAPPPASAMEAATPAASTSIVVELTNFIVARAEREAVNAFVVNLYNVAAGEPLLQSAFPNTWQLMKGLAKRADSTLNAVAVGRIPLTAWRATLASDFAVLPVSLLNAGPSAICGSRATPKDPTARAVAQASFDACERRVVVLGPLAPFAGRILEGDPVIDVLRDAESYVPASAPQLPAQWKRISEAVSVIASLAESYSVQGYAKSADPGRYPYILSPHALSQASTHQRDALERLLLVHAIATRGDIPDTIDATRMSQAIATATLALERISARLATPDTARVSAAAVVRSSFDAVLAAGDLASAIDPKIAAWIESTQGDWRKAEGVIEPLVARDFGLAFSRTTVLVHDIRGTNVPGPVLTFLALGSALAEAQTGQQMQLAFENAATPVGGWQAKRYGEGGFSINSFPGLMAGKEFLIRNPGDPRDISGLKPTAGLTLPVGIEWMYTSKNAGSPVPPGCHVACNWGFFVPIIDLGTVLSYRLGSSQGVNPGANATLGQVFAPGAYLDLALVRSIPVNLLLGSQIEPSLRRLSNPGAADSGDRAAVRIAALLSMDVQLLKF